MRLAAFSASVGDWPAFPDSAKALAALKRRFRLGVITNCDDDLFAASNRRLGVEFDWVVTAQQARGYKPDPANFEFAFERIDVPARADPARRPEPVPRPRAGQGARHDDGVDRPPPGTAPASARRRRRRPRPTWSCRTCWRSRRWRPSARPSAARARPGGGCRACGRRCAGGARPSSRSRTAPPRPRGS